MARLFDNASSEYLEISSDVVDDYPLTMAGWFYSDDTTNAQTILCVSEAGSNNNDFELTINGNIAGDPVRASIQTNVAVYHAATTTTGYSANTWHHACGVFISQSSRWAYIDGGSGGQNTTTANVTAANIDVTSIGIRNQASLTAPMSGRIAEAGVWNVALSVLEVVILAAGYPPLFVRPQSLVAYWALIRDEDQDRVGGYDMTAFNTPTVAEHPPIIYPTTPYIVVPAAGAPAAANIPEFMHHYQQQQQAG